MKKLLLATSAIIGAVSFASAASAEAPRVTVGGFIDFQAASVSDDLDAARRGYGFRNDTELHFSVDGKTDSGLGYGAVIELESDVGGEMDGSTTDAASTTYVYLDGGWGRFEMGAHTDAATGLKVDAASIARATGGVDGDWWRFASGVAANSMFIVRPDLPVSHGGTATPGATENASKITYYSPNWSGFQLGLSYAPDSGERGQNTAFNDTNGTVEDVISGGVSYNHSWDNMDLGLSLTFEEGEVEVTGADNSGWALGGSLGFGGFSLAGSWADVEIAGADGEFYTLGGAYDFGNFGVSVTWLDSSTDVGTVENDFENLSFGADYMMAPGFTPYVELSLYEFEAATAATGTDNDGTVFIVGTQLAF